MRISRYLPRWVWPWVGRWRSFWWGVVRSEAAQRRMMLRSEIAWSGKGLNPEELDELIGDQRPAWRRKR
jgi:hypothetical protein